MHTSKSTSFMALKVVVCIGSDSVGNVFSVRLVGLGLGGRRGPSDVDVCPKWCMGIGGMLWGRERNEMSNGRAVESERRRNNGSTAMGALLG